MERYSQFRDKATGISPFLPVLHTGLIGTSDSGVGLLIKWCKLDIISQFVLCCLRIVLMVPFALLFVVWWLMFGCSKGLLLVICKISGLSSYELSIQNLKAKNLNKTFYPKRGDVLFVNFSSPLDLIMISLISMDDFALLIANKNGSLRHVSPLEFLNCSVCGVVSGKINSNALDYSKLEDKVIYIFAEGTTSNGKSILPFVLNQLEFTKFLTHLSQYKIRSLGIKYYPSTLVTPLSYPLGGFLYKVLTCLSYSAKLRINIPNEFDPKEENLIKIRNSFTNNGKFKLVELGMAEKEKFVESYIGRR